MSQRDLYWEDVEEGQDLPPFTYELSLLRLVSFVRASGLYDYVHFDGAYARAAGARDAFISTPHVAGLFGRLLTDWSGPGGEIRSLTFAMRTQSCTGDVLRVTGRVGRRYRGEDGAYLVDLVDLNIGHAIAAHAATATATMALPSRTGAAALPLSAPADDKLPPADDVPDFARPFLGQSRQSGWLPAQKLSREEIHFWCEALEDWNPLYWDEAYAAASRYGGIIAPHTSMFFGAGGSVRLGIGYAKPGETVPDAVRQGLTGLKLLQSLRQSLVQGGTLVNPPDCPEIAVVQSVNRFYRPMRPGDTARVELRMKHCSAKKRTKLGEGYFVTTERHFTNQRGELIRTAEFTVFHYRV
ncbi:MAG: MaoC family dehydratase N-terminal domain-containing protein [Proteobacteria bacterium]|nr:MaoC family dehydratase N-terminal domain-containing protein [Pseudomonadota bacterium]